MRDTSPSCYHSDITPPSWQSTPSNFQTLPVVSGSQHVSTHPGDVNSQFPYNQIPPPAYQMDRSPLNGQAAYLGTTALDCSSSDVENYASNSPNAQYTTTSTGLEWQQNIDTRRTDSSEEKDSNATYR